MAETTITGGASGAPSRRWRGRLVLVHLPGGVEPVAYPLDGEACEVRRADERAPGTILVPHRSVSRQPHTRLRFDANLGLLYVEDLGRGSGTQLDGERVGAGVVTAQPGSVLRIGDALFVFSAWVEHPLMPDDQTLPPTTSFGRALGERMVDRAARGDVHVLLLGPTGAGKERLAERYHSATGRSGALVPVNCAGISSELFSAELFGHERGAFSGAQKARAGLWRRAHGGTLFLDEVAELLPEQQSAVLRALDSGAVRPVGSDADVRVDARVIAATSRDVDELESKGDLRADLIGRLAGIRIHVPGLRERREEVLDLFHGALGSSAAPLDTKAAEALLLHDWPKNVRELLNAAKVVKLFAAELPEITLELLPEAIRRAAPASDTPAAADLIPRSGDRVSREDLEALLVQHRGNVEQIARRLSVGRATVHRWLSKYGLSPKPYR